MTKLQTVRIQEIREKCISVEVETLEEAIEIVEEMYCNEIFVLLQTIFPMLNLIN